MNQTLNIISNNPTSDYCQSKRQKELQDITRVLTLVRENLSEP